MKVFSVLLAACVLYNSNSFASDQDEEKYFAYLSEERVQFVYQAEDLYHCDFLRAETGAILRRLGARDVTVSCTGGLPYDRALFIDARFISTRQTTSEKSTRTATLMPVSVSFSKACYLHKVIVNELLVGFDSFDYIERGNCSSSRGGFEFEMKTLF